MGRSVNLSPTVRLSRIDEELFIAKLGAGATIPAELLASDATVVSITRTASEVSIVCPRALVPQGAELDGPWSAWYVVGPIPFGLTGVVQAVVSPLSERSIPVFVVSTFNSDILMAPASRTEDAAAALSDAGHELT